MPSPHAEVDVHPNHPSEHRVVVYDGRSGGKWLVIETGKQEKCRVIANFLNKWPELITCALETIISEARKCKTLD